jgi:hypothetical protein
MRLMRIYTKAIKSSMSEKLNARSYHALYSYYENIANETYNSSYLYKSFGVAISSSSEKLLSSWSTKLQNLRLYLVTQ